MRIRSDIQKCDFCEKDGQPVITIEGDGRQSWCLFELDICFQCIWDALILGDKEVLKRARNIIKNIGRQGKEKGGSSDG